MVEDELRKAAGTEENVDESLAAGPTQQVSSILIFFDELRQIEAVLFSISIFFLIQKLVTADGTYATQSAFSSAPDKKKGSEVKHHVDLRSTGRKLYIYDRLSVLP